METYKIVRFVFNGDNETIQTGLSLEEAQEYCKDPETSWSTCEKEENVVLFASIGPWFCGYTEE